MAFLLFGVINIPESFAQSQPCLDFRSFPATSLLPSPVVAPPGETIPSDIHLYMSTNNSDEYAFLNYSNPNYSYQGTVLFSQEPGELIIFFDNPSNSALITFTMIHFNQPEIEYRLYDSSNFEITSGWTQSDVNPNFDPYNPVPDTNEEYNIVIGDYFNPNRPVELIKVRNLSFKNAFVGFCVY